MPRSPPCLGPSCPCRAIISIIVSCLRGVLWSETTTRNLIAAPRRLRLADWSRKAIRVLGTEYSTTSSFNVSNYIDSSYNFTTIPISTRLDQQSKINNIITCIEQVKDFFIKFFRKGKICAVRLLKILYIIFCSSISREKLSTEWKAAIQYRMSLSNLYLRNLILIQEREQGAQQGSTRSGARAWGSKNARSNQGHVWLDSIVQMKGTVSPLRVMGLGGYFESFKCPEFRALTTLEGNEPTWVIQLMFTNDFPLQSQHEFAISELHSHLNSPSSTTSRSAPNQPKTIKSPAEDQEASSSDDAAFKGRPS